MGGIGGQEVSGTLTKNPKYVNSSWICKTESKIDELKNLFLLLYF